jgi:DNA repair protein SbcC/Rad50
MKILQLRFKNLNSLAGEWSVDFTAPGYLSDGIFAISGPTGSGKSTILDAICLALYGQTPRLGKITNSSNEIMSRQTGECFAEVVFQANGIDYRSYWSHQRARKKANGALQQPRHEISEAESGKLLADKLTEVKEVVEERTGMDFNRFTQSMMLAQGGFAVFLKATPGERAPILEQITGTEIYSEISVHVFEHQRAEKEKLEQMRAGLKGILLLGDEEEQQLDQELVAFREKADLLEKEKKSLEKSITWLNGIEKLQKELVVLAEEENNQTVALSEFEPQRLTLLNGLKAAAFDGEYATLTSLRKIQQDELNKLIILEEKLPGLEEKLSSSFNHLNTCRDTLQLAEQNRESELKTIRQVREMDQHFTLKNADLQDARSKLKATENEMSGVISKKKYLENSILTIEGELAGIYKYLSDNETDNTLVTELAGIKEQIRNFKEALNNLEKDGMAFRVADQKLKSAEVQVIKLGEARDRFQGELSGASELVSRIRTDQQKLLGDRTLTSIRSEIGSLYIELAKLQKIADLESERLQLADNVPCPLCGSLHHPWAEGNVPGTSETERKLRELTTLVTTAENLEKQLSDAVSKEREASGKLDKSVNELTIAGNNLEILKEKFTECQEKEQACFDEINEKSVSLLHKLAPFGIPEIPMNGLLLDKLYIGLEERKNNLVQHQEKKTNLDRKNNEIINALTGSVATLEGLKRDITGQSEEISRKANEISVLVREREEKYGNKTTEEEERKINDRVKEAEKQKRGAENDYNQNNLENNSLKTGIQTLKQSTEKRSGELKSGEGEFMGLLQEEGFAGEEDFLKCRLSKEETARLTRKKDELDSLTLDILSRKKEREIRLSEEKAKKITAAEMEGLIAELNQINPGLTEAYQKSGALQEKKEANDLAKTKNLQLKQEIEFQQSVYNKWYALNALIGSADGRKFRNFAQGLTFELMVAHANRQLARLSDRYLLVRDQDQPLELNVTDNYQAGEIRTTKNLSGGESFIVSLALALGLSQMSSRKVRVDSLFLDEGFGTLDEDALDTALETLAGLRQEGKLIGVISHVAAFKDRINTRITVQPVRGGKSVIAGPGVNKVLTV